MDEQKKQSEQEEKANAERKRANRIVRVSRRKKVRAAAKALGHKLGSKNRKCKLCGVTKASGFGGECSKQLPATT